jgi:hypothetical protein
LGSSGVALEIFGNRRIDVNQKLGACSRTVMPGAKLALHGLPRLAGERFRCRVIAYIPWDLRDEMSETHSGPRQHDPAAWLAAEIAAYPLLILANCGMM